MAFKNIPAYSRYSISEDGQVRNDATGKLIAHTYNSSGYKRVSLYSDTSRKYRQCTLHRLLASVFLPGSGEAVNHIDGNKLNNSLDNLEWCSRSYNTQDSFKRSPHSRSAHKRLTASEQETIRLSTASQQELAAVYGVSPHTIRKVRQGGYRYSE